jgi:hypothetical protein
MAITAQAKQEVGRLPPPSETLAFPRNKREEPHGASLASILSSCAERVAASPHTLLVELRRGECLLLRAASKPELELLTLAVARFAKTHGKTPDGLREVTVVPKVEVSAAFAASGKSLPGNAVGTTPDENGRVVLSSAVFERSGVFGSWGKLRSSARLENILAFLDERESALLGAFHQNPELRVRTLQAQRLRIGQAEVNLAPQEGAPYGVIQGRPILGRDMPVLESVYAGSAGRVLKVVKAEAGSLLHREVSELQRCIRQREIERNGALSSGEVLRAVFDHVTMAMEYDLEADNKVLKRLGVWHSQALDQIKVDFNYWVELGRGVCGDMAIFAASLSELLVRNGTLNAAISFERSNMRDGTAHAWARATTSEGQVYFLDPAGTFFGGREEVPFDMLEYLRPEDSKFLLSTPQLLG